MPPFLPGFALSVRQPWAWAIIHAGKDVENRSKLAITKGGMGAARKLAVHAAKGMTRDEYESASEFMASIGVVCPRPDELIRGGIIGSVYVTGIAKTSESAWFFGPWALTLERPSSVDPIGCRGQLGVFFWETAPRSELDAPLPWMKAWPGNATRSAALPIDNQMGWDFEQ